MITINETQRKIIHLLNDFGIDRISMAGILGTLEQDNLNENSFLDFIKNKEIKYDNKKTALNYSIDNIKMKYINIFNDYLGVKNEEK